MSERPKAAARQNPSASTSDPAANPREARTKNLKLSQSERIERLEVTFSQFYQKLPVILADERKMILEAAGEADKKLLDSLIDMLTKKESQRQGIPPQQQGPNRPTSQSGDMGQTIKDFIQAGKDLGLIGGNEGEGQLDQILGTDLSKMLIRSLVSDVRKSVSVRLGVPFHEEEGEHG